MPTTGDRRPSATRVLFMGTPALAVPSLSALIERFDVVAVATQPDRRTGRGRRVEPSPVKARALAAGVPVLQPPSLRTPGAVAELASFRPDVIAVVAYGLLLPPSVLDLPRLGCVNVHASLLPRHRGASPIQGAILAGDVETGVTTMLMDEGLDTGPLLEREAIEVLPDDTATTLGGRLAATGAALLVTTLEGLEAGRLTPVPQDDSRSTTTGLIRKEHGRIDWGRSAKEIERQVRAMQPWPSAFTFHGETRLQVWRAEVGSAPAGIPAGMIVAAGETVDVACGDGSLLRVVELQRPGGRRLDAQDFLRGYPIPPGARLGSEPDPEGAR